MEFYLQLFISGLVIGSIYSLVALGFVIIYKATKVVNFAQGEMLMAGAYVCFALTVQAGLPFLASFLLTLRITSYNVCYTKLLRRFPQDQFRA